MENASKALLIAGAILLSILIIAIGMYIFTSAKSTITESTSSMSTREKDAFNEQFTVYEGAQTGSSVKALIGVLVANADTYRDEPEKIPSISVPKGQIDSGVNNMVGKNRPNKANDTKNYVEQLGTIRNRVEDKHTYWIEITFGQNGLVDKIILNYDHDKLK